MIYRSTRGRAEETDFTGAMLAGLAGDGGLYVPAEIPPLPEGWTGWSYDTSIARTVEMYGATDVEALVKDAATEFHHPEIAPIVEVGDRLLLELFHGPTLSFKDHAMQVVGRLLSREIDEGVILGATSGDTGSAAIEACRGSESLKVVILYPDGGVSDFQRRQMTTVNDRNVQAVAVRGSFDDCQRLVKEAFATHPHLLAVNSINWARIAAQIVYYVSASATLGRCVAAVPTGNFGNILAGWIARRLGAPIEKLVIGSNRNDILARWVRTATLQRDEVVATLSPAMDIQVSSNHERLLFELSGRDGRRTAEWMTRFRQAGAVEVPVDPVFDAASLGDDETVVEIADLYERTGYLADPHTAVGIGAGRRVKAAAATAEASGDEWVDLPLVCLSTAHPAKFPDAVEKATGVRPGLPEHLVDLFDRPESYDLLPADLEELRGYVAGVVKRL